MFKPKIQQMSTTIRLQHRVQTDVNGQPEISYTDDSIPVRQCNFKPFYGQEAIQAGALQIADGGTITMWYDPAATIQDRVLLNNDTALAYEVISIENVEMRNWMLILKVRRAVNA